MALDACQGQVVAMRGGIQILGSESVNHFDHQGTVEGARQGRAVGKAESSRRSGGVPGIPDQKHVVPDYRDPVEAYVEVDTLALVVVLHEREQTRARVEVVLEAARREHGVKCAGRQARGGVGEVGADDDVAAAVPRYGELRVGAVAAVEAPPIEERAEREWPPGAHRV